MLQFLEKEVLVLVQGSNNFGLQTYHSCLPFSSHYRYSGPNDNAHHKGLQRINNFYKYPQKRGAGCFIWMQVQGRKNLDAYDKLQWCDDQVENSTSKNRGNKKSSPHTIVRSPLFKFKLQNQEPTFKRYTYCNFKSIYFIDQATFTS